MFSVRRALACGAAAATLLTAAACTGTPNLHNPTSESIPSTTSPLGGSTGISLSPPSTSAAGTEIRLDVSVTDGQTDVSVIDPVTVRSAAGTLDMVTLTNPDGKHVDGTLAADNRSWQSTEPLGYGKTYVLDTTATGSGAAAPTTSRTTFTTASPAGTIFPSFEPAPDRGQVGVGQPLTVIFDKPPADKAAAERTLTVTAQPATEGAWYWWDERTVHWRPREYWKPGTVVTLSANTYGKDLGGGFYGETDRSMTLTIGPSKIATIDDATKQMTVTVDGQVVRQYPISLGRDDSVTVDGKVISFVTPSGTYVAQEKYDVKQMSSASYGLPTDYALGYDSQIPLAVRLSNSGIFAHSAPWSVADQGVRNVSHGCINQPPADAQWFYDNFSYGDIVTVTGTSVPLAPDDGYGDWNIPWEQWLQGSALS